MADDQGWAPGGPATLFILGVLHLGLFFFATSSDQAALAPALGLWILGISAPLICYYSAAAQLTNSAYGRNILPM
jgi:succinate-acetate transporter protein